MNFLFATTLNFDGQRQCIYKVYKSKLMPTEYRAELVNGDCMPLIFLYRENGNWRTIRETDQIKQLAALLSKEIDKTIA